MSSLRQFAAPLFKAAAPGANKDVFATSITPPHVGYSKLIIRIQLVTASVVNLMQRNAAADELKSPINGGVAIPAGKPVVLEDLVHSDFTYNFQIETDGVISSLNLAVAKTD